MTTTTAKRLGLAAALLGLVIAAPAHATLIDPATLFVGNGASGTCPTGATGSSSCPYAYNTKELLAVGGTALSLYQNQGGAQIANNPLLLLLGVPVTTAGTGTIGGSVIGGSATEYDPFPGGTQTTYAVSFGTTAYGLNASGGLIGEMTSGGDLYTFLGSQSTDPNDFKGLDSSQSFTNWSGADGSVAGITGITGFNIYVFAIDTSTFAAKSLVNLTFSGIPTGTFFAGFGINSQNNYGTPFTEAGIDTIGCTGPFCNRQSVPEPTSLALLGTALVGFGALLEFLRRWQKS